MKNSTTSGNPMTRRSPGAGTDFAGVSPDGCMTAPHAKDERPPESMQGPGVTQGKAGTAIPGRCTLAGADHPALDSAVAPELVYRPAGRYDRAPSMGAA